MTNKIAHTPIRHRENVAAKFLRKIHPQGPWILAALRPDNDPKLQNIVVRTFSRSEIWDMHQWIARWNMHHKFGVYYHLNVMRTELSRKATKQDVMQVIALQGDLDPFANESLEQAQQRILKLLQSNPPPAGIPGPPTGIIFSGGGYQPLWMLSDPPNINGDEDAAAEVECYTRGIEEIFGSDRTHSVDHILRLPGTINWPNERKRKRGQQPEWAVLISWDARRTYDLSKFKKAPRSPKVAAVPDVTHVRRIKDLKMLNEWGVGEGIKTIIEKGHDPKKPKTGDNSRSAWLFQVVCYLVRAQVPDSLICGIITDARWKISESVLEKTNVQKYAQHQITSAHDYVAEEGNFQPNVVDKKKEMKKKKATSKPPNDDDINEDDADEVDDVDIIQVFNSLELFNDPRPTPPELVIGLIRAGERWLIVGTPKIGKTYTMNDLGIALATGTPYLGFEIPECKTVYYAQGEMAWHQTRERFRKHPEFSNKESEALLEANLHVTDRLKIRFDLDGVNQIIESMIETYGEEGPDVFLLDSLSAVYAEENEDTSTHMLTFLRERIGLIEQAFPGITIVMIHHPAKYGNRQLHDNPFNYIRGSGALRGWYDGCTFMLHGDFEHPNDTDITTMYFERRGGIPPDDLDVEILDGMVVCTDSAPRDRKGETVAPPDLRAVVNLLKEGANNQGVAWTLRSFALEHGSTTGPFGMSAVALETYLLEAVLEEKVLCLFDNPLEGHAGGLGVVNRAELLTPVGYKYQMDTSTSIDQRRYKLVRLRRSRT